MGRRRSSRRRRRKSRGGLDNLQGLSPKAMQKALGQIDTDDVTDVEEVIIRKKDEEIIMENPEVTVMNMGQEVWNIVPNKVTKRPRGSSSSASSDSSKESTSSAKKKLQIKADDVKLIMNTADVSKEEAIAAIKRNKGDIAAAIMDVK